MKKNVIIIAIVVIIAIVIKMVAVNMDKNVNIDMQKLAEELNNEKIFEDNLSQIDRDTIIKRYNFNSEKIKNINSYVGTGATAEEILIIECLSIMRQISNLICIIEQYFIFTEIQRKES